MDEKTLEGGRFFMSHISFEDWLAYLKNELEEEVRKFYDDHLYDCDDCLTVYLEAMDSAAELLPMIRNDNLFTNEVMQKVTEQKAVDHSNAKTKPGIFKKEIFHYIIAAGMTIFLMSSGVFSNLINVVGQFDSQDKNESSIVSNLMDKSISIIDKVGVKLKEGE